MIRTIIVAVLLMGGGLLMASTYTGYPAAGTTYIKKHRAKRSMRTGSGYYGYGPRYYGSRSFRGGGK